MARFHVVVAVAAVAPGAAPVSAANPEEVEALVKTATGSPRDFTTAERHQAVHDLARRAGAGDDVAARGLVSLLGSGVDDVVLESLERLRAPVVTVALRASLDRTRLDDDRRPGAEGRVEQLCVLLASTRDPSVIPSITRVVDDGGTKELRVACLRSLARVSGLFAPKTPDDERAVVAATRAVVAYVDHPALGKAARDVLLHMRASVEVLRPLLQHKNPEVRELATRALAGAVSAGGAPGDDDGLSNDLAKTLEQQLVAAVDDNARARALRGLGNALCGGGSGGSDSEACPVPANGRRLVDVAGPFLRNPALASAALTALARVRDPRLVPLLVPTLRHEAGDVREKSAVLLGRIGDVAAQAPLQKRLDEIRLDGNWTELDALVRALVALGVNDGDAAFWAGFLGRADIAPTSFAGNHKDLWTALARLSPSTSKAFVPLLRNPSRDTRRSIARLLGQLGNADAAVPLLDLVEQKNDMADDAATALASCADASALPRMQALLEAKLAREPWSGGGALAQAFVRVDRADGLERTLSIIGKHGPLGVELLRALLHETHPSDARAFAHAFAQRIDDASDQYTYRWLAIDGWSRIDTRQSLDVLCGLTRHADDSVRKQAAVGLRRFPEGKAVSCMVDALQKTRAGDGDDIARALEEATGQSFGKDVKAWRTFVDSGLGLGSGDAALTAGLTHASSAVRALAATKLGVDRKGLVPLLERLPHESDPEARTAILGAVAVIVDVKDDARAKAALIAELEKKRATWPEKVLLARALDRLGDGRGTLVLLKMLDDPEQQQRAMLALSEVTGEPPTASSFFWRQWWKTHGERYRFAD